MNIDDTIQKIKDLEVAYRKQAQDLIAPAFKSLVQGKIKGFRFYAYTPYFNDGEECVYRVVGPDFSLHKDITTAAVGEEVRIDALDTKGKIVAMLEGQLINVKLSNGKSITLPLSQVSLVANDENEYEESSYSYTGDLKKQASDIEKFVRNIPKDIIKMIFDDHVQITVTADKIEVTEYNHE